MSGKKPFKSRWARDPGASIRVINKIEPFTEEELKKLLDPIREAFEAIKTGAGTERQWSDLVSVINSSIVRSRAVHPDAVEVAGLASDALTRTWYRFLRTGVWGFDGPAIAEVEAGIDLHEQLCRLSTPLQMLEAAKQVRRERQQLEAQRLRENQEFERSLSETHLRNQGHPEAQATT